MNINRVKQMHSETDQLRRVMTNEEKDKSMKRLQMKQTYRDK